MQEEIMTMEGPPEELPATSEEVTSVMDDFQERRAQAIAAKAREIEKVWTMFFISFKWFNANFSDS